MNRLEEIGQKPPKTPFYHHMQCIFDPKRAKTDKTRFSRNFHGAISYIDPKYSLNIQNKEVPTTRF